MSPSQIKGRDTNKLSFHPVYSILQHLTSQRNNIKLVWKVCGVVLSQVKPAFASSCLLLDGHSHLHLTKWNIPLVFLLKFFKCFEAHEFENVRGVLMETEIDRFLTH